MAALTRHELKRRPLLIRLTVLYPRTIPCASAMLSTFAAAFLAFTGAFALPACALTLPVANLTARASVSSSLFPVSPQISYWTTDSGIANSSPLSDATFRPHNQITALSHDYVTAPDGKKSMQAQYPEGSYTFSHDPQGGFSFYAPGPSSVDLTTAKEATFSYDVYFPSGFNFVKGGKLPGLCKSFPHAPLRGGADEVCYLRRRRQRR